MFPDFPTSFRLSEYQSGSGAANHPDYKTCWNKAKNHPFEYFVTLFVANSTLIRLQCDWGEKVICLYKTVAPFIKIQFPSHFPSGRGIKFSYWHLNNIIFIWNWWWFTFNSTILDQQLLMAPNWFFKSIHKIV